ncbi:hypothetical protein [Foetidibacter luteolus]|uniref:hypothetical protein n=1 Tax=Foetidibacter luteolus TaxID=2608880 RepID=UPI00129A75FE|nr:hypothetical protein [Foetidibacter luteolus]
MKTKTYIRAAIAALMIFSLFSCRKTWDYIKDHPKTELKFCNIKKITNPDTDWKELVFTYNAKGNPVKIIPVVPWTYTIPMYFFRYDKFDRLTDVAFVTEKDFSFDSNKVQGFWTYHKYTYLNNGNVIDSAFLFGHLDIHGNPKPEVEEPIVITTIQFDSQKRIRKTNSVRVTFHHDSTYSPPSAPTVVDYPYNQQGNLIQSEDGTPRIANNKQNILRTNNIWMFLNRDYSVNGQSTDMNFNCFDLPAKSSMRLPILDLYETVSGDIEYMCDCNNSSSLK